MKILWIGVLLLATLAGCKARKADQISRVAAGEDTAGDSVEALFAVWEAETVRLGVNVGLVVNVNATSQDEASGLALAGGEGGPEREDMTLQLKTTLSLIGQAQTTSTDLADTLQKVIDIGSELDGLKRQQAIHLAKLNRLSLKGKVDDYVAAGGDKNITVRNPYNANTAIKVACGSQVNCGGDLARVATYLRNHANVYNAKTLGIGTIYVETRGQVPLNAGHLDLEAGATDAVWQQAFDKLIAQVNSGFVFAEQQGIALICSVPFAACEPQRRVVSYLLKQEKDVKALGLAKIYFEAYSTIYGHGGHIDVSMKHTPEQVAASFGLRKEWMRYSSLAPAGIRIECGGSVLRLVPITKCTDALDRVVAVLAKDPAKTKRTLAPRGAIYVETTAGRKDNYVDVDVLWSEQQLAQYLGL